MTGYPRIWILALAAFIYAAQMPVYASDFDPIQLAAADDQNTEQANEAGDSEAAKETADEDADQASEAPDSDATKVPDDDTGDAAAKPTETGLIDSVSVVVQSSDDEALEQAKIELSAEKTGSTFKKITDDEGTARFKEIPAGLLNVKVTARGYRSYKGEFTLENGDDPIVIKLRKRD